MSTSRKILYITFDKNDPIAQHIGASDAGEVVAHDPVAIAEGLSRFVAAQRAGQSLWRKPDPTVGFDERARAFVSLIRELRAPSCP
jgi:hypothetical protein